MGKKNKNKRKNRKNGQQNNGNNYQNQQQNNHSKPEIKHEPQPEPTQTPKHEPRPHKEEIVHFAEQIEKPQSSRKTIITFVVVIVLAFLLTLMILFSTGLLKPAKINIWSLGSSENSLDGNNNLQVNNSIEISETDEELAEKLSNGNQNVNQNENTKTAAANYSIVRLPMLLGSYYDVDVQGKQIGCDTLWWVERKVPATRAILNATYRELFNFDQELDFYVGNYAAKQSNLNFDYAVIENRIAKVYLTGEVDIAPGECDQDRLRNQITEAALQFKTVDGIEIYLNGKRY